MVQVSLDTSGDPSQNSYLENKIYYQTDGDTEIGTVALTPYVKCLRPDFTDANAFTSTPHAGVALNCTGAATFGTDGVLTLDDAPSRFLVVGDRLAYFSGGIGVGTGKFISEIDNEANTIKVDISGGAPTIPGTPFVMAAKTLSPKAIRFDTPLNQFAGNTGQSIDGGEVALFVRRESDALRPNNGLFDGSSGAIHSNYTQADFDAEATTNFC